MREPIADEQGYYRHPTIHDDRLVFVCEDDLWSVSLDGGIARRLTVSPGTASFPAFSPDGSSIAFTASDDGPAEAYVIPADGGTAHRMTWFGCLTQVVGWRPNGRSVVVASSYQQPFPRVVHLHDVPVGSGQPRSMPIGPARAIAFEPGGPGVVVGRNSGDPARWKRYRGGTAGTIWIDRGGDGGFTRLLGLAGNLANPMWIGDRIYFLSDHEGFGNLYSCDQVGGDVRRHTHHEDFYVRFPSTDGRRIAYHAGADLFVHDVAADVTRAVDVRIRSPRAERQRRFVSAERFLEGHDLHPDGHSVVAVTRGGCFTMALWDGPVVRRGATSSCRYRLGRWVAGCEDAVAVGDDGSGDTLVRLSPNGVVERVAGDFGRAIDLAVDPTGKRVALTNERLELVLIELKSGRKKLVCASEYDRVDGLAWSADGRYLAFGFPLSRRTSCIKVLDRRTGSLHDATGPDFRDVRPSFDPEGKYLYFLSWRVFDPVYDSHYFDLGFPRGMRPFLITLSKDEVSPFDAASRKPRAPAGDDGDDDDGDGKRDAKAKKTHIDWEGIGDRVVGFPVPEGIYGRICGLRGGDVAYSCFPALGSLDRDSDDEDDEPDADGDIEVWEFDRNRSEIVIERVSDFAVAASTAVLAVRSGCRLRVVHSSARVDRKPDRDEPGRESGWVDLERMRVEVLPGAEWRQMFLEAWRLQRDHFWTPDMSGVDWEAVRDRYLPLVDRVASRAEFSDLLWEMQGELGTSHCYELGGDYRPQPEWHQGYLGADLELEPRRGEWRIARIPRGDSWDAGGSSPLRAPGVGVEVGDVLVTVDGQKVDATTSPGQRLVNLADEAVELAVVSAGRGRRKRLPPRVVAVTALSEEHTLRYRDWVEGNRATVHKRSRNRIGYVHIPNMGPLGYAEFHRYFATEVDHDGLIIDVRWNGGGHVSQLILEKLLRRPVGYDLPRWGKPDTYPSDAPRGPMVALTNEHAGSDGDIFSHCFKHYQLGPLIGKRTWGGVIGIWPRHSLVDGSVTTQAEFASWFEGVGWGLENYGVDPDIEIDNEPGDYAAGRDAQLERGLQELERLLAESPPKRLAVGTHPRLAPVPLPKAQRVDVEPKTSKPRKRSKRRG